MRLATERPASAQTRRPTSRPALDARLHLVKVYELSGGLVRRMLGTTASGVTLWQVVHADARGTAVSHWVRGARGGGLRCLTCGASDLSPEPCPAVTTVDSALARAATILGGALAPLPPTSHLSTTAHA